MAGLAPYSDIYFCVVPWDADYKGVCDGASPNWIASTAVKVVGAETYVRRDQPLRVNVEIAEVIQANYVMYRNKNHENKWMYAFITDMRYVNEGLTEISIQTDIYQTFRAQLSILPCFTVREHVDDDAVGANLVPEALEPGEPINSDLNVVGLSVTRLVIATTSDWSGSVWVDATGGVYNGAYAGVSFHAFAYDDVTGIISFVAQYVDNNKADAIVAMFLIPSIIVGGATGKLSNTYAFISTTHTAPARPTKLDGYTPKNNKLLTHPYTYLYANNNNGGAAIFRYEQFTATPQFLVTGNIGTGPTVKLFLMNKRTGDSLTTDIDRIRQYGEEAITLSGYPMVIWNTDAWRQYISGQGAQVFGTVAGSALSLGVGIATMNPIAVAGGAIGVASQIGAIAEHASLPPQAHGSATAGSANLAAGMQDIVFTSRTCRAEYAKIIDEYFSTYGYKVARVKVPNTKGRRYWNYVQTIDASVKGGMPASDRKTLAAMFDRGVTIWHDPVKYGDYTQLNEVV